MIIYWVIQCVAFFYCFFYFIFLYLFPSPPTTMAYSNNFCALIYHNQFHTAHQHLFPIFPISHIDPTGLNHNLKNKTNQHITCSSWMNERVPVNKYRSYYLVIYFIHLYIVINFVYSIINIISQHHWDLGVWMEHVCARRRGGEKMRQQEK